jgi:hypothetical protein
MNATDLQAGLARLAPGETLLVSGAEVERAFNSYPTPEERWAAAALLAALYRCGCRVWGTDRRHILFIRHDDPTATFQ